MTNEEFQKLVLQQFKSFNEQFNRVNERLDTLSTDVSGLKTDVGDLKTDFSNLKSDASSIKMDVSSLKTDVAELKKGQLRLESRIESEVIEKIRGLYDNREVVNDNLIKINGTIEDLTAQVENLKEETFLSHRKTNEKIDSLDSSVIYLANKLTQHDMQLFDLKRRAK